MNNEKYIKKFEEAKKESFNKRMMVKILLKHVDPTELDYCERIAYTEELNRLSLGIHGFEFSSIIDDLLKDNDELHKENKDLKSLEVIPLLENTK